MTNCCLPKGVRLHAAFFTVAQEKYDIFIIHPVIWQDPIFPHSPPHPYEVQSPESVIGRRGSDDGEWSQSIALINNKVEN